MPRNTDIAMDNMLTDKRDPWVAVGTTAVDGTDAELAAAFNASACAIGACIAGDIEVGHVVEVRGRHLRPLEWVDDHHGCRLVYCQVVRRQSEIDAERMSATLNMAADAERERQRLRPPCPECGPHGNAGRVLLLESWVDCTTCRPRPTHLVVDGGDGQSLTIDLEKDALEVRRTRSLKLDPQAARTQVYFASGRSETLDVPPGADCITIDDAAETVKFTGWRDAETTSTDGAEQAVRLRNGMFGHVEHAHENEPRYLVRVRAVNGDARKWVLTEDIKTFIPAKVAKVDAVPPAGLAYPAIDDVQSSLSVSLIVGGASSEVAQQGVRAFMQTLKAHCQPPHDFTTFINNTARS